MERKNNVTAFIEDAIAGGYSRYVWNRYRLDGLPTPHPDDVPLDCILIDPTFWQAVGKTRGWITEYKEHEHDLPLCWCKPKTTVENGSTLTVHQDWTWNGRWHEFIDHLADGDDIETALSKLV